MSEAIHHILPYFVNFSVVVILLFVLARKPLAKYVYQRHEHMKDAVESAAEAHKKAVDRHGAIRKSLEELVAKEAQLLAQERSQAEQEKLEILDKANQETKRIQQEAERLVMAEREDATKKVHQEFLNQVVKSAEEGLRKGLKRDDHSAIVKRAQASIEVGV